MTTLEELDLIAFKGEVTVEMLDGFKSEMAKHQKLAKKYFWIAEVLKVLGLASPLWITFGISGLGFWGMVSLQVLLWGVMLVGHTFYHWKMRKEESEVMQNERWLWIKLWVISY